MGFKPLTTKLHYFLNRAKVLRHGQRLQPRALLQEAKRPAIAATIDQAIVSAVNFATGLALARYLSPASFGVYALIFAALMFINGLQSALVTSPLMVLTPRYREQQLSRYLSSLWIIQLAVCLIAAGVGVSALLLADRWWPEITRGLEVIQLVLLITAYLGQEFVRRVLFVLRDGVAGLTVDLISYGLQSLAIVMLIISRLLTLDTVLWAIGITSLLSCVYAAAKLRPTFSPIVRADVAATWRLQWEHGRWLTGSSLAQWASAQIYIFVVAAVLSRADAGVYAASRNLVGFANIFILGLENYVPATAARRLVNSGFEAFVRWINKFRVAITVSMGAFFLLITLFADPLMHLIFGPQYGGARALVALMALTNFLLAFNRGSVIALRALGETRWLFYAHLTAALVTISICVPLVLRGGLVGAGVGLVITQVIMNSCIGFGYLRVVKATRASKGVGTPQQAQH